jgi:hypothetical protein
MRKTTPTICPITPFGTETISQALDDGLEPEMILKSRSRQQKIRSCDEADWFAAIRRRGR